jgi:type II secretory pathway component PulF
MPRFRYTAVNSQGEPLDGEIHGASASDVRAELQGHGLQIKELHALADPIRGLTNAEAAIITQQVATATHSQLPLVGALRGFAEEVFSDRFRRRLNDVCDALETGEPLEQVLSNHRLRLSPAVASILGSGLPPVAMNHLLSQTLRASTTTFELRMRAFLMVSYSLLMLSAILGMWLFLLVVLTPLFSKIFEDFGTQLPLAVMQLINMSKFLRAANGLYFLITLIVGCVTFVAVLTRLTAAARRRLWCGMPIIGAMYRLAALSEFANLLALMLESEVPLAQAVVWSAAGTNDADLRQSSEDIAARLRWGDDPHDIAQTAAGLPSHLQQMLRWAAQGAAGAEPLRSMAKLLQLRAKSLSLIALPVLEPILLIVAVMSIVAYTVVIFMPLIKLLNDLS